MLRALRLGTLPHIIGEATQHPFYIGSGDVLEYLAQQCGWCDGFANQFGQPSSFFVDLDNAAL